MGSLFRQKTIKLILAENSYIPLSRLIIILFPLWPIKTKNGKILDNVTESINNLPSLIYIIDLFAINQIPLFTLCIKSETKTIPTTQKGAIWAHNPAIIIINRVSDSIQIN